MAALASGTANTRGWTAMSVDTNKALARRIYNEVINDRNLDLIDELMSPDFVDYENLPGVPNRGPAAARAGMAMLMEAFSDLRFTENDLIAEGDKVAARVTMTGTHTGEFMGIPPTSKSVDIQVIDILEFRDGLATAHWGSMDQAAMMEQLGLAPPM